MVILISKRLGSDSNIKNKYENNVHKMQTGYQKARVRNLSESVTIPRKFTYKDNKDAATFIISKND